MPDLQIDLDALHSLRLDLTVIARRLRQTEQFGGEVAACVGHRQLAHTVSDFAGKWNVHRDHVLSKLDFIEAAMSSIVDTFDELDTRLTARAEKLDETTSPRQLNPGPHGTR